MGHIRDACRTRSRRVSDAFERYLGPELYRSLDFTAWYIHWWTGPLKWCCKPTEYLESDTAGIHNIFIHLYGRNLSAVNYNWFCSSKKDKWMANLHKKYISIKYCYEINQSKFWQLWWSDDFTSDHLHIKGIQWPGPNVTTQGNINVTYIHMYSITSFGEYH